MNTRWHQFGITWVDGKGKNAGDSWFQIGRIDEDGNAGEALAIVMLRDVERREASRPGDYEQKLGLASAICTAMNNAVFNDSQTNAEFERLAGSIAGNCATAATARDDRAPSLRSMCLTPFTSMWAAAASRLPR